MDNDLISRSALKKALLDKSFYPVIVKNALEKAPTIDPATLRPTGRWLWNSIDNPVYRICNTCANVYRIFDKECPYNYCPNCGAKMMEE